VRNLTADQNSNLRWLQVPDLNLPLDNHGRSITVNETLTGVECTVAESGIRAKLLSDGGPAMWAELMDELREIHLGLKPKRRTGPIVGARLQAAYEKVMAKRAKG
jgi:hypothetical protein